VVATIVPGGEGAVREALADFGDLVDSVGFGYPTGDLSCVTAFGSDAWDRLFGAPKPAELHPFAALEGPRSSAPSTPGDVLLHIRAENPGLCFDLARRLVDRLGTAISIVDETHGFRYLDRRDLLGFVDGTANPHGAHALESALIGPGEPFEGGSYLVVQKYLHDLTAWNALTVGEQERVIGRSKLENIEIPDAQKPADSHVAMTTVTDASGKEHDIMRFNMPFGELKAGEFGTYFIGYAASAAVIEEMLRRMFLGIDEAPSGDRILDFSVAVTGGLFFVPPADFLDDPPEPGGPAAESGARPAPEAGGSGGSLRIGSLKASTS
jgi:putative iron-dependent peroxidase